MSITLSSSTHSLSAQSSFYTLAQTNTTQPSCPLNKRVAPIEFQPAILPFGYVLGRHIAKSSLVRMASNVASFIYSHLPSFTLTGAMATAVGTCNAAAGSTVCSTTPVCTTPTGSYENSCHRPVVTYLPEDNQCVLKTRCETMFAGLPNQMTSYRFSPGSSEISLENVNGTLVLQRSREAIANEGLEKAANSGLTPEALKEAQDKIIKNLNPGDVITVNGDRKPEVVTREEWPRLDIWGGFSDFQKIAKETGGLVGYTSSAPDLTQVMESMSAHILGAVESSASIDIAFVLDTTSSMNPYITQVRNNLVQLLGRLQSRTSATTRAAVVEYKDAGSGIINRVNSDFTSNLSQVQETARGITTWGGDDVPEAVLDALLVAANALSWNTNARRIVVLIGDAPPHPRTLDDRHDMASVIAQYRAAGTQIAVYPIFANPNPIRA